LKGVDALNYEYGVATNQVSMDTDIVDRSGARKGPCSGEDSEGRYSWVEEQRTIDLLVKKPQDVNSAKDLNVKFQSKLIKISSNKSQWSLELNLFDKISPDDCTWTLSSDSIEVTLEKVSGVFWNRLAVDT